MCAPTWQESDSLMPLSDLAEMVAAEMDFCESESSDYSSDESDDELLANEKHAIACQGKYLYRQVNPVPAVKRMLDALEEAADSVKKKRLEHIAVTTYEYVEVPERSVRVVLAVSGPPEESVSDSAVLALESLFCARDSE